MNKQLDLQGALQVGVTDDILRPMLARWIEANGLARLYQLGPQFMDAEKAIVASLKAAVVAANGKPLHKETLPQSETTSRLTDHLRELLRSLYGGINDSLYGELDRIDAFGSPSAALYTLPRGWKLEHRDDGIVVSHKDEGAVFVREDKSHSIAELILFYLADDLMDPALRSPSAITERSEKT